MYSGNHSPCHPLDTLMGAAEKLADNSRVVFAFVGGGSEFARVKRFATDHGLKNILCLPYQPLDQLAGSLSAADLQVVVMGDPFVGLIHPCKIYNILGVGAPVLYLGPSPSHLSEILAGLASEVCVTVPHGEAERCAVEILRLAALGRRGEAEKYATVARKFAQPVLLPHLVTELERA